MKIYKIKGKCLKQGPSCIHEFCYNRSNKNKLDELLIVRYKVFYAIVWFIDPDICFIYFLVN